MAEIPSITPDELAMCNAIYRFKKALPGWWFTIGECSVSCDATVGPDIEYCDKATLVRFDAGIMIDVPQPSTMAEALEAATAKAVEQLAEMAQQVSVAPVQLLLTDQRKPIIRVWEPIYRRFIIRAIELGFWALPDGMTVDDVLAGTTWTWREPEPLILRAWMNLKSGGL